MCWVFFSFFLSFPSFSFKFVDVFDRSVRSVERFSGSSLWISVSNAVRIGKYEVGAANLYLKKNKKNKSRHAAFSQK